jgi:hypothetical protein
LVENAHSNNEVKQQKINIAKKAIELNKGSLHIKILLNLVIDEAADAT